MLQLLGATAVMLGLHVPAWGCMCESDPNCDHLTPCTCTFGGQFYIPVEVSNAQPRNNAEPGT